MLPLLLTVIGLSGCGDHRLNATTITSVRDAVVVAVDGTTSPATVGRKLASGEALRTAAGGAAVLTTGGRAAYVGGDTLYYVRSDGAELRRGALIVDARSGPRAVLDVGPTSVALPRGSVVRLERTAAVRVGALAGPVELSSDTGSRLRLTAYHQAVVVGRVLPSSATPLVLTDDQAERQVVPDLVADDEALRRTAAALDSGPDGRAIVVAATRNGYVAPAAFGGTVTVSPALATRTPVSEVALPVAIARAARGTDAAAVVKATRLAVALRAQGGSWGVVARLVGTTSTAVSAAIDALIGSTLVSAPGAVPGSQPSSGPTIGLPGSPNGPTAGPSSSPKPGTSKSPTPRPTPSPSATGNVVDDVRNVVDRLTPSPLPSLPLLGGPLNP